MNHIQKFLKIIRPASWNWQAKLVIPVVGGMVCLALIMSATESVARVTILNKFYQDVALADRYSRELPFDNLVAKTESGENGGTNRRGRSNHFENCSSAGTYHNYDTGKTILGAITCTRNFVSYFEVDEFNVQSLVGVKQRMTALGWREVESEYGLEYQVNSIENQTDGTIGGATFERGNNIKASMRFLTEGSEDYRAYCRNQPKGWGCGEFEKANRAKRNIMVVTISAYKYYDE